MIKISNNPTLEGLSSLVPGVVYSKAGGRELSMDMIIPQNAGEQDKRRFPLILFVQGSAWHCPDTNYEIPQLAYFAASGYAVASIRHRNISEGYPAPAFLQDAKTAVRFLRANADAYHVDRDRIFAFGTSSGGNTVLLLGLTGDDPEFKTSEYADESDVVSAVIDCFGPTDLVGMVRENMQYADLQKDNPEVAQIVGDAMKFVCEFCGGELDEKLLEKVSPVSYVKEGKKYVPFMIAHGNADPVVSFSQSEEMAKKLKACGADVELVCVEGAEHEGTFWSRELLDIFLEFLKKQK